MKYVFVINSHTTFLTSIGTVEYLSLDTKNVIFIATRNYKNSVISVPYKWIDGDYFYIKFNELDTKNKRLLIPELDSFIDETIKDEYHLFVPHLWDPFFQALYTNKACAEVSYVQEGAYTLDGWFIRTHNILKILKWKLSAFRQYRTFRLFFGPWYRDGFVKNKSTLKSYAINDRFFHMLPSKNIIVKWPSVNISVEFNSKMPVFIFDGFVTNGLVEKDFYWSFVKKMIEHDAESHNYVKFHPAQSDEEKQYILDCFSQKGCKAIVMDNDVPFEFYISNFKNMKVIGSSSSLLCFALDFGHQVISHDDWLLDSKQYSAFQASNGSFSLSKLLSSK